MLGRSTGGGGGGGGAAWYHDDLASTATKSQKDSEDKEKLLDPKSAVRNARATCGSVSSVRVTWDPPEDFKVDGYRITRLRQQVDPDSPVDEPIYTWQLKNETFVKESTLYFDEKNLAENTTFRYKVTAWHYDGSRHKIYGRQAMTNKFRVYEELPEGWSSADTPEGKRYYFNVITQHTQWEKPTAGSRTFLPLELAKHFTPEEVIAMRREFDSFDIDNSGSISADELEAAFVNLGFKFSKPQFVKIFAKVDADGSGFVDFQEYAGMYVKMSDSKLFQGLFGKWGEAIKSFATKFSTNARLRFEESLADLVANTRQKMARKLRRRMPPIWRKTIENDQEFYYNIRTHETSWVLPDEQRYYLPDDFETEFTPKELKRFRELFDKYDFDDSGTMNVEELTTALRSLGTYEGTMSKERAKQFMEMCDADNSGQIEFCEFCVAVWAAQSGKMSLGQMFMNFLDQAKGLDSKTARLQRQEKKEAADEERRKKERVTVGMVFSFTITRMRKSGKENIKHYTATVLDVDKDLEGDPTAFPHLIQYVYDDGNALVEVPEMEPEWMRLLWKQKTLSDQFGHTKVPWKLYKVKRSLENLLKGALGEGKKDVVVKSESAKNRNSKIKMRQFLEKIKIKTKPKNKRKVDVVKRWFQEIGMSKKQIAQRREEWAHDSARFIQKHFRGRQERKQFDGLRVRKTYNSDYDNLAATLIQGAVRRRIAARKADRLRVWTYSSNVDHSAALKIQTVFRGRQAKKTALKKFQKIAYLHRTKKRSIEGHVQLMVSKAKTLADKLSKSVNNEMAKIREKEAEKARHRKKKELKAKFARATKQLKKNIQDKKAAESGVLIKEKFEKLAQDMREQSKTLADKAKAGMDKFKAALKKTFSKENLQSKAEMVKAKMVEEWKKKAAEFKASKVGQQLKATQDEFKVVQVKKAPRKVVEGKALFAFTAENAGELTVPEDANVEILEVYNTQEDQIARAQSKFVELVGGAVGSGERPSVAQIDPDGFLACLQAGDIQAPEDAVGEESGSALRHIFAEYGDPKSLHFPNGTARKLEDARMSSAQLQTFLETQFAAGSTWVRVRNQDNGAEGRVPLSFIHLFDPLPKTETREEAAAQVDTFWTKVFESDYRNQLKDEIKKTINDSKFVTDLKATTAAAVAATKAGLEKAKTAMDKSATDTKAKLEKAFSVPNGAPGSSPKSPQAHSETDAEHEYERTSLLDARCKECGAKNEQACHKKSLSMGQASSSDPGRSSAPAKHKTLVRKRSQVMPAPEPVPSSQTASPARSVAKKDGLQDSVGQGSAHSLSI